MANVSIEIEDENSQHKLTFLLDKNNKPESCFFTLAKFPNECWDNEDYLEMLHHTLDCSVNVKPAHPQKLVIRDVIDFGINPDAEAVLEMFEKAVELGLWELKK